jgi:dipeptidyl aminopeptidase/acylaminoacyl peptidase
MPRFLCLLIAVSIVPIAAQTKRALTIEDYYRIQTVQGPSISPDGRWVTFTVATRLEEDNRTATETWVVPSDASAQPSRVRHYGRDVAGARWTDGNRLQYIAEREQWTIDPARPVPTKLVGRPGGVQPGAGTTAEVNDGPGARAVTSPDGRWVAWARDKAQKRTPPAHATDFERRHEERFKGVTFDWKDFQRDGQPFPSPSSHTRAAA